jgi:hypothetical protein
MNRARSQTAQHGLVVPSQMQGRWLTLSAPTHGRAALPILQRLCEKNHRSKFDSLYWFPNTTETDAMSNVERAALAFIRMVQISLFSCSILLLCGFHPLEALHQQSGLSLRIFNGLFLIAAVSLSSLADTIKKSRVTTAPPQNADNVGTIA